MTKRFSKRDVLKGASVLGLSAFASRVAAAPAAEAMTPALIEAAKKEGKVAFYTAMDLQFAERLAKRKLESGFENRDEIQTMFDYIDADEGRT